jgi:hypothetical protein
MTRRPKIPLTPAEHAVIRLWTLRILGVWVTVVAVTLSLSLLGADRSDRARAEGRTLNRECAREDAKAVAWIDEQAQRRIIPSPLLAEAALRVLQARNACLHGRVAAALEAYEAALRSAPPDLAGR